ncbi:hypothetical protein BV20DRAFT_475774 [Pilatotrama ljubarskyi]|nr:hypothetical protein BV20DRAFT_475774 [Pilatotrama ljubarskyi]
MSAITKNIKFRGGAGLGMDVKFTLAIVPPGEDTFKNMTPVAWKVFSLKEGDSVEVTWTDHLAGCRATVDKSTSPTSTIATVEYQDIPTKKTSDLVLDTGKRPPVYHFSDPAPLPCSDRARIINRTGKVVDSIGAGFITGDGTQAEKMNVVLASGQIADGQDVYIDHIPVAKLWVSLDYKDSQLLGPGVNAIAPVWEQNLLDIGGTEVSVVIERDASGKIISSVGNFASAPTLLASEASAGMKVLKVTYTATFAFSAPALVAGGLNAVVSGLGAACFPLFGSLKSTLKESDYEAQLTLTPSRGRTCRDAELAVVQALQGLDSMYGKTYIKSRKGAELLVSGDGHDMWMDINPASDAWAKHSIDTVVILGADVNDGADGAAGPPSEASKHTQAPISRQFQALCALPCGGYGSDGGNCGQCGNNGCCGNCGNCGNCGGCGNCRRCGNCGKCGNWWNCARCWNQSGCCARCGLCRNCGFLNCC